MLSPSLSRENRELALELKFLVDPARAEEIRAWCRAHLAADPNGAGDHGDLYRITSLYYDTADFSVFHQKGSYARSKYRVRKYGDEPAVFLERKLKTRSLVSKRRTLVPVEELPLLETPDFKDEWSGAWYRRRLELRDLRPVCQISYKRTARVTMTQHGPIRLTLDDALVAQPITGASFLPVAGTPLSTERIIVEMKFRREMPTMFKQVVEQFRLSPTKVSKYRLAAAGLGLVKVPDQPVADAKALYA